MFRGLKFAGHTLLIVTGPKSCGFTICAWRSDCHDDLVTHHKASLDILWLKDESLEGSENLPAPGVIAAEIVEDLVSALEQMRLIAEDLGEGALNR
jgi:hypothetical protein